MSLINFSFSGPAHILCLTVASGWNKERCEPEIDFSILHSEINFIITHSKIDFSITHSEIYFNIRHSEIYFRITHSKIDFSITHSEINFSIAHSEIYFSITHSEINFSITHFEIYFSITHSEILSSVLFLLSFYCTYSVIIKYEWRFCIFVSWWNIIQKHFGHFFMKLSVHWLYKCN
jgi:hypothetical protein